ncbi:unnamed protein product [Macrosiphum euphorbiae]|uniref:Uncharacterized protein n=1 Tax=Macrosiphum euphorbiae TaxID=13131 RepID=A0AAV0XDF2_9HEMI|nr:unnamed protein product [Macrosiphum euphorbiae]
MGHTKDIHKHYYRLTDNAFHVGKVSKLLLLIEKGEGQKYRGNTLDEINISANDLVFDGEENEADDDFQEKDSSPNLDLIN